MVKFIVVRILQAIPTLFIIATLTFFMTRLAPGGPFDSEKNIPAEIKEKLEAHFGLEKPLYEQYFLYLSNLLQGDLGPSFKYMGWEVSELIAKAFPVSAQLGLFSLLIALVLGLPAGVLAALRKNSVYDYCLMTTAMLGICLPTFVMGPLLILLFSSWLGWLPPLGWYSFADMILPSLTLGLFMVPTLRDLHELACWKLSTKTTSAQPGQKVLPLFG